MMDSWVMLDRIYAWIGWDIYEQYISNVYNV
jgi:hypothetical protein